MVILLTYSHKKMDWWNPAPGSNVGLDLVHSWSRVILWAFQLQLARSPT